MKEVSDLNLFDTISSVEEIKEGYYKRKKYIVTTPNKKYFIKVLPYKITEEEIEKTKWIYKAYEQNNIPLVPLLDITLKEDKTILIYPYLKGKNLKDLNLTLEEYNYYGQLIAKEVQKMNNIKNFPESFKLFDLKGHYNEYIRRLNNILMDNKNKDKIVKVLNDEEIDKLKLRFQEALNKIENDKMMLNHNDIKLANVMLDKNNNYYLVDIEPINLTPIGFNLNYSIYTILFSNINEEKQQAFIKGFIKIIDPKKELMKEWEYFIISDFINELSMLINKSYDSFIKEKDKIKEILFNKNNILEKILY